MRRRYFLQAAAALPVLEGAAERRLPVYTFSAGRKTAGALGMPGPFPGKVTAVHSPKCIDEQSERVDAEIVREMIARGMTSLTGTKRSEDAWRYFFSKDDVIGIKVNCSGTPGVVSSPEVVSDIVRNLMALGVRPDRIYVYERFKSQMDQVNYAQYLPAGVHQVSAESRRGDNAGYDPAVYVEVNFFGEEDTRSNLTKVASSVVTKIINVPNMKDHGASGVTGCLKNIAYGSFSNVARSHSRGQSNTYSFIGALASVEPLRSKTVLQIMDGIKGVWHGGPFSPTRRFRFYPKQMMFGTDPVAIDRLLIDIIDDKRKAEGAISVWDRSPQYLKLGASRERDKDPNVNLYIREPGHIEHAARLGLGVYDMDRIRVTRIDV